MYAGFAVAVLVASFAPVDGDSTLRVMSWNVRYDNPADGDDAWPNRKEQVAEYIQGMDVAGLQEALAHQISDLAALLPEYAWFGVGRDDGVAGGEFTPVFYRHDRLELLESDTFWLSETPEVPGSRGWDAAITRIVTYGQFRDRLTGAVFRLINTHFDHRGQEARRHSAELLIRHIGGDASVIVTGDFNAVPRSEPYRIITAGHLSDAHAITMAPPKGPAGTWSGFVVQKEEPSRRIDYVFVGKGVSVREHHIIDVRVAGRYVSDHLPVVVMLKIPAN